MQKPGIKAADLLEAGYGRYADEFTAAVLGRAYLGSYSMRFADGTGTRYVIRLHHGFRLDGPAAERGEFWCPEVQMTRRGTTFNVEVLHKRETLAEIEAFVLDLWHGLRIDYAEGPGGVLRYPQSVRH